MFQPIDNLPEVSRANSVDQVVDLLTQDLSLRDKVVMAGLTENELNSTVYLAMAKIIRKEFGLYDGNTLLLKSCCSYLGREYDPYEDPAMVIVKELWKKIRKTYTLRLVK